MTSAEKGKNMVRQARYNLFNAQTVAAGAHVTSAHVPISHSSGYFAVNGTMSGADPDIQIEYLTGDGNNFVIGGIPIVTGQTSSPIHIQFSPEVSEYLKIKVTNNSASEIVLTLNLIFTE